MKHIDLFSGIGGFSLALDTIFYDQEIEHVFCDNNPFSQAVIRKHWPNAEVYGDIRTLTHPTSGDHRGNAGELSSTDEQQAQERPQEWFAKSGGADCFLVTGGFPCQPFSSAGRRQGTADDRYLWPEMFRVIAEFQPEWVVAENVRGLVTWNDGLVLEQVCTDLESQGYEVQPLIIPAVAVNAPHRRDRVWFVAHRKHERPIQCEPEGQSRPEEGLSSGGDSDAPGTAIEGWTGCGGEDQGRHGQPYRYGGDQGWDWNTNWLEVATELCSVDDGLPARMGDTTISRAKHRSEQLKAYGNAIVPQVAMEIFSAIRASL